MQFVDLPSDIHNIIRNLAPTLLLTSKQLGGTLLNAGEKMDLLLEMGYSVTFEKNTITWYLFDKEIYADELGYRRWYNDEGARHRKNGPAVECPDGRKSWWLNGERHREDGPAVEDPNGYKEWWINGELHREDGPAIEYISGYKEWWVNGKLHRENGPAIEYPSGYKGWWVNGKRHREGGPAIEHPNGNKEWWIKGICCKVQS